MGYIILLNTVVKNRQPAIMYVDLIIIISIPQQRLTCHLSPSLQVCIACYKLTRYLRAQSRTYAREPLSCGHLIITDKNSGPNGVRFRAVQL